MAIICLIIPDYGQDLNRFIHQLIPYFTVASYYPDFRLPAFHSLPNHHSYKKITNMIL